MRALLDRGRWGRLSAAVLLAAGVAAAGSSTAAARACGPATVALEHPAGYPFGEVLAFGPRGVIGGTVARPVGEEGWEQAAVLWRHGRPSLVGDIPQSFVADVNARGDVLVTGGDWPDGRALLLSGGAARELSGLHDGGFVYARRLNDRGDVVGAATPTEGAFEVPVKWPSGGGPVALPLPDGAEGGLAQGVNERGDAVGLVFGPDLADAYVWRADGSHGRLSPGDWGPDDPGFGAANVIDDAGRIGGTTGPLFAPGAVATLWTRSGSRVAAIGDGWATFYGTNDQGDFVGGAFDEPERTGTLQLLLMREDSEPLTLLPLSGNVEDEALAHAVSTRRHGDVTVGGFSTPEGGGEPVATLWRCAYAQALPYETAGAASASGDRGSRRTGRPLADRPRGRHGRPGV